MAAQNSSPENPTSKPTSPKSEEENLCGRIGSKPQPPQLPPDYELRELNEQDFDNGFVDLLEQLTATRPMSREQFEARLSQLRAQQPPGFHIFVVQKLSTKRIVATATLVLEWKFIHGCGARGRIEDVVVDEAERGKHFGRVLNQYLVELARHFGVYKLSLECTDKLVSFYEQFGFRRDGNQFLVQRF